LLLSSCATIKTTPPAAVPAFHKVPWQKRQAALAKLNAWTISGSIGATYNNNTDIASFDWQNISNNRYVINMHSPLNLKTIRITGDGNETILWTTQTQKITAKTPEELLVSQLGWPIPISNMIYWVKALPAPHVSKIMQFDDYNHLTTLKQQGWQIQYSNFTAINGIDLPLKIYFINNDLHIKMVIKRWQLECQRLI
jgi:outer membrane lipoprotein LolB